MNQLTIEIFNAWLERYGNASKENNPQASADLFTREAKYYQNPFSEPLIGRVAIYEYFDMGAQTFADKQFAHEILSVVENTGIARWMAQFRKIDTNELLALDCIFLVQFGENRECIEFREWWHLHRIDEPIAQVQGLE